MVRIRLPPAESPRDLCEAGRAASRVYHRRAIDDSLLGSTSRCLHPLYDGVRLQIFWSLTAIGSMFAIMFILTRE